MTPHPDLADVVTLTQRLIAFDTINPPGREAEAMRYCASLLKTLGFACDLFHHSEERASLVASRAGEGGLWFSGHLDTVPLGDAPWRVPPLEGRIEGDRLYGRGSSDMKGGVAAFLVAIASLPYTVSAGLILTVGEQTGCDGARWLAEAGHLPRVGALVVGESTGNQPFAGHKGVLWLQASTQGRTAHGATPDLGENAIAAMTASLARLCEYDPGVSHPLMGRASCNVGTIRAGINTNSVPDSCTVTIDLRSVEGIDHQTLKKGVQALCDGGVRIQTLLDLPAVWTDPEHVWFARASVLAQGITGQSAWPCCASYFTDASILKTALGDVPVMVLGPGSLDQPHRTNEWVEIPRLRQAVEIYATLLLDADWHPVTTRYRFG